MKLIECPRDAMQGLEGFIPTAQKVRYINQLLKVGFDTIDFGSFVSSKAIPQMRDTAEVLEGLHWKGSSSKLLAIVANMRGAVEAVQHAGITYLGFPLSISETFQQRNTNKSITEALNTVSEIQELCIRQNKQQVVYISMGFGNPYGDPYDAEVVARFVDILATLGVTIISLADTIGVANPENITSLFHNLTQAHPRLEFGVHLHSTPVTAKEKIEAAWKAGCRRFDGAMKGFGGCPMARDELVGNLATETIIDFLESANAAPYLNREALGESLRIAGEIFPNH
ncbi:hydroxymethylglutaryl-CoA lyase [Oscillatoria amoena NRMC-F 0135]|nr:hydroxymethylglutaryl-CoA lyase [Oscillatoria amoena NRMC-F 0135]